MQPRSVFAGDDFLTIEESIWRLLEEGVSSYQSIFHTGVVATISNQVPHVRTVVLRGCDTTDKLIWFHTDMRSPKVEQIRCNTAVSWLFYDPALGLQLRMAGCAMVYYNTTLTDRTWENSRLSSKMCYTTSSAPGTIIDNPETILFNSTEQKEDELLRAKDRFGVVYTKVEQIDWLYLHHQGHRRGLIDYTTNRHSWLQP